MKGAKELAKEMASVIKMDGNSFFTGVINGIIDIPIDLFYLGKDYFDTDNRYQNDYDRYRMAILIKSGLANRDSLQKIIKIALSEYFDKLSTEQKKDIVKKQSGKIIGSIAAKQYLLAGIGDIGIIFTSRIAAKISINVFVAAIISLGAMQARAIYTSRELRLRNPSLYNQLVRLGNLDLMYMLVEDITRPFEDAAFLYMTDRYAFNEVTSEFIKLV